MLPHVSLFPFPLVTVTSLLCVDASGETLTRIVSLSRFTLVTFVTVTEESENVTIDFFVKPDPMTDTGTFVAPCSSRSLKKARSGRAGWENGGEYLGRLADAGRKRAADHPCCHDDDR